MESHYLTPLPFFAPPHESCIRKLQVDRILQLTPQHGILAHSEWLQNSVPQDLGTDIFYAQLYDLLDSWAFGWLIKWSKQVA